MTTEEQDDAKTVSDAYMTWFRSAGAVRENTWAAWSAAVDWARSQADVPAKACLPDDHMYAAAAGSEIGEGTCVKCGEKEPADDPEQGTRRGEQ